MHNNKNKIYNYLKKFCNNNNNNFLSAFFSEGEKEESLENYKESYTIIWMSKKLD